MPVPRPRHVRFWEKVQTGDGCWLWIGAGNRYGHLWDPDQQRPIKAHRISWEMAHGPIPDGMNVLHRCDVPRCVRPDHLFLGTQPDNIADMDRKGRRRVLSGDDHPARRPGARVGERNGRHRLTAEDIPTIRRLASEGIRQVDIAARYGVAQPTIGHVVSRKNWRHVP